MHDPRRQRFAPYVRDLADRMGLKDWEFAVEDCAPFGGDAAAQCFFAYGQKHVLIRLSDEFLDSSPEVQRRQLVHEVLHAHFEEAWEMAADGMGRKRSFGFRRAMEYAIDGAARAWAVLLPLPPNAEPEILSAGMHAETESKPGEIPEAVP